MASFVWLKGPTIAGWPRLPNLKSYSVKLKFKTWPDSTCTILIRNPASTPGASGWSLIWSFRASSSRANFASTIWRATSSLPYFWEICWNVSHTRAPWDDVVLRCTIFLYSALLFHCPAQLIHSSSNNCNFDEPKLGTIGVILLVSAQMQLLILSVQDQYYISYNMHRMLLVTSTCSS